MYILLGKMFFSVQGNLDFSIPGMTSRRLSNCIVSPVVTMFQFPFVFLPTQCAIQIETDFLISG